MKTEFKNLGDLWHYLKNYRLGWNDCDFSEMISSGDDDSVEIQIILSQEFWGQQDFEGNSKATKFDVILFHEDEDIDKLEEITLPQDSEKLLNFLKEYLK